MFIWCNKFLDIVFLQKHKKKKDKKTKKDKKDKKKSKQKHKSDYEIADGITTPSKENLPPSQQETPMQAQLPVGRSPKREPL